jgi:NADPH2:quinone reductase
MKGIVHAGVLMLIPLIRGQVRTHHAWIMQQISDMAKVGQISPVIDKMIFGLNQVVGEHQRWGAGEVIGKIVINASP